MKWNLFLMTLILGSLPVSLSSAQNASFFNRNFPLITETGNYLGSPACIIQTYWLKSYSLDKLCQPAINQDNIPPVQVLLPITTQNPPAKSSNLPTQNNLPSNSSLPPLGLTLLLQVLLIIHLHRPKLLTSQQPNHPLINVLESFNPALKS
jgi:hypothetical protein